MQFVVTTFDLCSQFPSFSVILNNGKVTPSTKHLRSVERRKPSQLFRRTISYLAITLLLARDVHQNPGPNFNNDDALALTNYKVLSNSEHTTR